MLLGGAIVASAALAHRCMRRRQPRLRLTYLDLKSFGEPIRLALTVGGFEFEDVRVSYEEVARLRAIGWLPFGQVPVLEIDGKVHAQCNAILRWVGSHSSPCLYPSSRAIQVDAVEELLVDIKKLLTPQWYKHAVPRNPATGAFIASTALSEAQQTAVASALSEHVIPARFAQLERVLSASGGPYLCGKALSICDLSFYVLGAGFRDGTYCDGIATTVLDNCPGLRALLDRIAAHPKVAEWEARHS